MDSDAERILENLVRIGTVSSVNASDRTARVIYEDKKTVSGNLYVIQNGSEWMPEIDDVVLCLYLPVFDGDGFILGVT